MSDNNHNLPEDEKLIAGHDYDGIQELDNPLPQWWLYTFLGTIVFAGLYWLYYEPLGGPTLKDELNRDMAKIEKMQAQSKAQAPAVGVADIKGLQTNTAALQGAAQHYSSKCAACHGQQGEGLIGPNLTDKYWLHGKGTGEDILQVVRDGVLEKGMPAWGSVLSASEAAAMAAYILNMVDTDPANAKSPQGELVQ